MIVICNFPLELFVFIFDTNSYNAVRFSNFCVFELCNEFLILESMFSIDPTSFMLVVSLCNFLCNYELKADMLLSLVSFILPNPNSNWSNIFDVPKNLK